MKYIDIIAQTIILIATLLMMTAWNASGLAFGALCLGAWQMLSSVLCICFIKSHSNLRIVHLLLAVLYLAIFSIHPDNFLNPVMIVPPLTLAIYYYVITWKWFLHEPKRSKFLPNISF
jgi:hypothetical protein